ncbi:flagellar hook-basal body complex protein FliE [Pararhizobium mangrovi]|uniref:Flagellar hook-basal body complex protein FliE n=1 Tax=Pararhizobium mangrovi TaxID=2590452 RepID=A0A506U098_9HYPH|nr:flagellar hook-basal body complex protein FliE [Pararhizobium mangrovi]TPW26888.1 flagellar hook-basal body complex protein FliE [Pararhizobium mangrovi]
MMPGLQSVSSLSLTRGLGGAALDGAQSSETATAESAGGTGGATGTSFADTLNSMASDTLDSLRNAETMSVQGIQGKADTRQVVDAVMSAQQSLQTALAIRDKIVTAYLDVSRMSI